MTHTIQCTFRQLLNTIYRHVYRAVVRDNKNAVVALDRLRIEQLTLQQSSLYTKAVLGSNRSDEDRDWPTTVSRHQSSCWYSVRQKPVARYKEGLR